MFPAERDLFYRNLGDGRFEEVAASHGLEVSTPGRGLGVVGVDVERDGDVDLFVANDRSANFLFRNDGSGSFEEDGLFSGVAYACDGAARAGMGVDAGDADGDGDFDLLVLNFGNESATCFLNDGTGAFHDGSAASGIQQFTAQPLGFGAGFFDPDLDGDLDLYLANGHVLDTIENYGQGSTHAQHNQLLVNDGAGRFVAKNADEHPALAIARVSRGAAFGDLDGDGDEDVLVANVGGEPELIEVSGPPVNAWIGLDLRTNGRSALGATVEIEFGEKRLVRHVRSGHSYLAASDPRILVGLGPQPPGAVRLQVVWPDGTKSEIEGLAANQIHVVEQTR